MTIRGYNVYVGGVKVNDTLISGPPFTIDGIASDTDYGITITAVDAANLESVPSVVFPASTLSVPVTGGPLSTADRNAVDAIVAEQMAISKAPGVMISMVGPRGYYTRAYGKVGSGAGDRALSTDDHFRIGSGSKLFTGYAVFRCIDQGLLSLDDKLGDFVDGIPNGDTITIRMMLMMRSGVNVEQANTGFLLRTVMSPSKPYPVKSWLAIERQKAMSPPDTKWQYTNANYFLLGLVVEAVTGRPIRDVITEDIIQPLGLTETLWPPDAKIPAPFSKGYYKNPLGGIPLIGGILGGGSIQEITEFHPDYTQGAGAIVTTIGDLQRFAVELRDGTLLSAESHSAREDVWAPFDPQFVIDPKFYTKPSELRYGLGMYSYGTWVGHPGSMPGFGAYCYYDMDSGACMAGMENTQASESSIYSKIWPRIADLLYPGSMDDRDYTGKTVRPLPATMSLSGGTPLVTVGATGAIIPAPAVMSLTGGTPVVNVVHNKLIQPAPAVMSIVGGIPGANPIVVQPDPAVITLTGGTPVVTLDSFTPFSEENLNRVNRPVPAGATEWRWVGIGGGGPGGGGLYASGSTALRRGGPAGGGAAKIDTGWQNISLLGSTYSVTRGMGGTGGVSQPTGSGGGTDGVDGGHSTFSSGSVSLSANRGSRATGATSAAFGGRGQGGPAVVSPGITPVLAAAGTAGGSPLTVPPNNTAGGAAGGSGGTGSRGTGSSTVSVPGGSTLTAAGAALGTDGADQPSGDPGPGGGGNGGNGGDWGGGGGGADATTNGAAAGNGGDGYTLLQFR